MSAGAVALTPKQVASYLMRTTGPQQYFTQAFATLGTFNIPKNIPLDQPLAFLHVRFRGRLTVTLTFSALPPEAPQNIIQQIQLRGTHATLGSLTPFQMSGADAFALARVYNVRGNSLFVTNSSGTYALQPELGSPMGLGNAFFASGTSPYDIEINYVIPMGPYNVGDSEYVKYLYNSASWGQTLQLQIITADTSAFGSPGTGTFSAYGSASGSPSIDILVNYASLGKLRNAISQAVVVRSLYPISSALQANGNQVRLQLLQNQRTMAVILKTGTLLAGTSAGVSVFGTLSDFITDQEQLTVNNNPIRNLQYHTVTKEFYGWRNSTHLPQGYQLISFIDGNQNCHAVSAFKGERLPGSAQFNLIANIIGATGTNTGEVIQDQIFGEPVVAGEA